MPENPYQPPKEVRTAAAEAGPAVQFDHSVWIIPVLLLVVAVSVIAGLWVLFIVA